MAATLRDAGIPAALTSGDDEVTVFVPATRRDQALTVVSARMEEIVAAATADPDPPSQAADVPDPQRPLLFERLRGLGFVPIALAPLLVVSLANVRLPGAYTAALIIGGMVGLVAWRNGRRDRDGHE